MCFLLSPFLFVGATHLAATRSSTTHPAPVGVESECAFGSSCTALSLSHLRTNCNAPRISLSLAPGYGGMAAAFKVLVVGFGLSPRVGHLPAARATLCAMECTDRLRARGLARCHAGVATGPVFCGSLGSEDRREFAMISETVNLAQRLMSARKSRRLLPKSQSQVRSPELQTGRMSVAASTVYVGCLGDLDPAAMRDRYRTNQGISGLRIGGARWKVSSSTSISTISTLRLQ